MRRTIVSLLSISVLSACAESGTTFDANPSPAVDPRRVEIFAATIRDVIEFKDGPVYVRTEICDNADQAGHFGPCTDSITAAEQEAIASLLVDEVPEVTFVEDTEAVDEEIFVGANVELVRLGQIEEIEGRIQVAAMHNCGNVCGGGSVWILEERSGGWVVTGSAPGHGEWIS